MRKIVEIDEAEGLERFLGERITLFCMNYFYTGKLVGVNDTCVKLSEPSIVYDTGAFDTKEWADAQRLPQDEWYVSRSAIESFGAMK